MSYQKRTQRKLQCKHCDNEFIATRFDAKFCSRSCAVLFKREEKRLTEKVSVDLDVPEVGNQDVPVKPKRTRKKVDENVVVYKTVEFDIRLMDLHQCKKLYDEIRFLRDDVKLVRFIPFLLKRIADLEAQRNAERIRDRILSPVSKKPRQRANKGLKNDAKRGSVGVKRKVKASKRRKTSFS